MSPSSESPCIGICSTVYGDNVCRGCKRNYIEVIEWNRYEVLQKQTINARLQQQIESVTAKFITITDEKKLKAQLNQVALRPPIYSHPMCWAYELLRLKARQIINLDDYGIAAKPPYHVVTPNGLFTVIDDTLYKSVSK